MAATISATASTGVSANTTNPVSFASMASGTAAADRISVAAILSRFRTATTGCTINGISATKAIERFNGTSNMLAAIYYVANPSGTTATVAITFGNAASGGISCQLYRIIGANTTPVATDVDDVTNQENISISGLTIPSGGCGIWAATNGEQTQPGVWSGTGVTATMDRDAGTSRHGSAYSTTAGTPTVGYDDGISQANHYNIVGAAWEASAAGGVFPHHYYFQQYSS